MFKTLVFFIILGFVILLVYSGIKIVKELSIKPKENKLTTYEEIESLISTIKLKIIRAELDQLSGYDGAEKELLYWKDQLVKTNELKSKTKNL